MSTRSEKGAARAAAGVPPAAGGVKHDLNGDKLRYDLVNAAAEEDVVRVLTYGARKYAPDNWKKVKHARRRYLGALLRHLRARFRGDVLDPETKLPHLAHAACCLMFLQALDAEGVKDDSEPCGDAACAVCFPGGKKGEMVQPALETFAAAEIPTDGYTIPTHEVGPGGKIRPIPKKRRPRGGRVFSRAKRGRLSKNPWKPRG